MLPIKAGWVRLQPLLQGQLSLAACLMSCSRSGAPLLHKEAYMSLAAAALGSILTGTIPDGTAAAVLFPGCSIRPHWCPHVRCSCGLAPSPLGGSAQGGIWASQSMAA